jgi:hypothetical protein
MKGKALTQGVVNARIDGVPVYSAAKTKYQRKIGIETTIRAFQTGRQLNKYSRERLLHFAGICRVGRPLRLMYSARMRAPTRSCSMTGNRTVSANKYTSGNYAPRISKRLIRLFPIRNT